MDCTRKEPQYPLSGTVPLACLPYEEADRVSIPIPTKEVEERLRDHSRGRDSKCNRNSRRLDTETIYVWKILPVVHILPELNLL